MARVWAARAPAERREDQRRDREVPVVDPAQRVEARCHGRGEEEEADVEVDLRRGEPDGIGREGPEPHGGPACSATAGDLVHDDAHQGQRGCGEQHIGEEERPLHRGSEPGDEVHEDVVGGRGQIAGAAQRDRGEVSVPVSVLVEPGPLGASQAEGQTDPRDDASEEEYAPIDTSPPLPRHPEEEREGDQGLGEDQGSGGVELVRHGEVRLDRAQRHRRHENPREDQEGCEESSAYVVQWGLRSREPSVAPAHLSMRSGPRIVPVDLSVSGREHAGVVAAGEAGIR